jgi:hypothetical protein
MRWLVEWWPSRYLQCISSNSSVQEVKEILDICEKNGWVKPPVYQGRIIQRSGLGRTLFPSPAETWPFFQRIQVGAMHNRLLSTRHLTRYLASVRRALLRRIQEPPHPHRWDQSVRTAPHMNVPTYSPFLKTTAPLGKTYSSMSIQNSTTSAPERVQSAADEPV